MFSTDRVRKVERSAIVPFSPAQMFELVADLERYPEFLDWCVDAKLLSRNEHTLTGRLSLAQGPLKSEFTTRNQLRFPQAMTLELLEGPFSQLEGAWEFLPLGDSGCRMSLILSFEFANLATDLLLGAGFEKTCNRLVDAFVDRAFAVYGRDD